MKEFEAENFREQGHKLVDKLADYLSGISKGEGHSVLPDRDPEALYQLFYNKLRAGENISLMELTDEFIASSNHLHHPGYIGHQCTAPLPSSALTHFTAGLLNNGSAVFEMGPANTAMEKALLTHIAQLLGYDESADGVLTHGGSAGNLTALLAARQARSSYNIWEEGVDKARLPAYIVSEQSHYSISRNLKIMGLGEASIIPVASDKQFRMRTDLLQETLDRARNEGKDVICVVGNACSTATGSYDRLESIADFCEENNLWFHVDGAHGMGALMSDRYRNLVKGVERADSVIIDFHKMFLITGLNTAVIFKDGDRSYETFAQKASYLFEKTHGKEWYNSARRTLECTKSSMGFHAYTTFRLYGDKFFSDYIENTYGLAREFNSIISESKDFESISEPEANILCFRYTGKKSENTNELNLKIRDLLIKRGKFYIVQAELSGKIWLRVTIINPLTNLGNLKDLLEEIRYCATVV